MSANTILILQSLLITLQIINAAIGTSLHLPQVWTVAISACTGGFQFYVTHVGNNIQPK